MKTEIKSNSRAEHIFAYSFEAIDKGDYTQKIIDSFSHLEKIPYDLFTNSSFHVGAYDYSIKLNQWKIPQVKETINEFEKENKNLQNQYGINILKNALVSITLTVCEPEFLPYNFIIIKFELDVAKTKLVDSYRIFSGLLNAFNDYWLSYIATSRNN